MTFDEIDDCVSAVGLDAEGNMLMYKMYEATASLNPSHGYTPWITINGKHSEDAENNLLSFLCEGALKEVQECKQLTF